MKKILFYTANGVGLGHIRRSSLIAKEILTVDKKSEVFFVSMCKDTFFLEELKIPYQKLIPVSDKIIKDYKENQRCKKLNEEKLSETIKNFKPDKVVFDIHVFANFSFPDLLLLKKYASIEKILIYRMTNRKNFVQNFDKFQNKFKIFDKIIIPHSKEEMIKALSEKDYKKCAKNDIISFSGPIYRKLDRKVLPGLKKRYNLSEKNFNISIALGGGGELKKGQCETPANIILRFLKNYKNLVKIHPRIKITLVTGPLFRYKKIVEMIRKMYPDKIKIVNFENSLMELFHLSDLIISPLGYNAGNEILEAKTPALLVPLYRGDDNGNEQMERAKKFEKWGITEIFDLQNDTNFDSKLLNCIDKVKNMKDLFARIPKVKKGNKVAAKIILK